MSKENRYIVIKRKDVDKYLSPDEASQLGVVCQEIMVGRSLDMRGNKSFVVVAEDWPMYDDTWRAIEQYAETGEYARTNTELNQDIVDQLAAVIVERDRLEAQNRALAKTLDDFRRYQHFDAEYLNSPFAAEVNKVLAQSPVEIYKAQMDMLEAVNSNRGTLAMLEGHAMAGSTITHILTLNDTLQRLEHNRGDGS